MKSIFILIIVEMLALASSSTEPKWYHAYSPDNFDWWVFVNSNIKKPQINNGYYQVWVKYEHRTEAGQNYFKTNATETLVLYEFDSTFSKYRTLQQLEYDIDGNVLKTDNILSRWTYVVPESLCEKIVEAINGIINGNY